MMLMRRGDKCVWRNEKRIKKREKETNLDLVVLSLHGAMCLVLSLHGGTHLVLGLPRSYLAGLDL